APSAYPVLGFSLRLSLRSLRLCVESHSPLAPASPSQGAPLLDPANPQPPILIRALQPSKPRRIVALKQNPVHSEAHLQSPHRIRIETVPIAQRLGFRPPLLGKRRREAGHRLVFNLVRQGASFPQPPKAVEVRARAFHISRIHREVGRHRREIGRHTAELQSLINI